MFAGFQTFECKQGKKFDLVQIWNATILPELAKQSGCKGGLLLVDPESNKCWGIEIWEDDVAASSFDINGTFQKLSEKLAPVVAAPPERTQLQIMAQNVTHP